MCKVRAHPPRYQHDASVGQVHQHGKTVVFVLILRCIRGESLCTKLDSRELRVIYNLSHAIQPDSQTIVYCCCCTGRKRRYSVLVYVYHPDVDTDTRSSTLNTKRTRYHTIRT